MKLKITTNGSNPKIGQLVGSHSGNIYTITAINVKYADDYFGVTCDPYDYGLHDGDDKKQYGRKQDDTRTIAPISGTSYPWCPG